MKLKMKYSWTILFFLFLGLITSATAQKTFSTNQLIQDFDYLVKELRLQHKGLYQYESKEIVDEKLKVLRSNLSQPKTLLDFYSIIKDVIALTNEGHTGIDLPAIAKMKMGLPKSLFPLGVRFYDKEMIVDQNFGENIPTLKQGMKILAINGKSIPELIAPMLDGMVTDGFNETSKYEWMGSVSFGLLYRLYFGAQKEFEIEVQEFGASNTSRIKLPAVSYLKYKGKHAKLPAKKFNYKKFSCELPNDSVAYLSIPSFGRDLDYEEFYQKAFQKIKKNNIKHLIIDVQSNGGGTEGNENLLYSYLSNEPMQKYAFVGMPSKPYLKNKDDKNYIFDKWALKEGEARRGQFTLMSNYLSDLGYQNPKPELIYNGKVYVLISGYTFSGGAEFSSMIKMTNRGIFIGEETGGTYEGNISGYSEMIKLPNSKIKVDIPIVHFRINVNPKIRGRGVMPDYEVRQSWEDYINTKNSKLEYVLKQIIE